MKKFWLASIRFYQRFLSPDKLGLAQACRFTPTCSEYTYAAIEKYGSVKGWRLGLARIARCHPFNTGGLDPVPNLKGLRPLSAPPNAGRSAEET